LRRGVVAEDSRLPQTDFWPAFSSLMEQDFPLARSPPRIDPQR